GYFETPSEVSLDELADELDITRQALSNRIRLGNEKVLYGALLSSSSGTE
ncbi:helix-turn-helix domain-containing protein, partial [Haloferax profundi]